MNVLSLFDGLAGARIALDKLNIPIDNYFSSEVNQPAINIGLKNYPDIIPLGDVRNVNAKELPKIDLLIGGSPCQDLSSAGSKDGLKGEKSGLFFQYIRLLEETSPKYFLLENVASMDKNSKEIISIHVGVNPIRLNSSHFSAQRRDRLYWTNIPLGELPPASTDVVRDIWEGDVPGYDVTAKHLAAWMRSYKWTIQNLDAKSKPLLASYAKQPPHSPYVAYPSTESGVRRLTELECERLQHIPEGYTEGVARSHRYQMIGNGFTISVIAWILSQMETPCQ